MSATKMRQLLNSYSCLQQFKPGWVLYSRQRQAALVPDIEKLTGTFDGQIDVFGSLQQGLISKFDFLGKDWRWGDLVGQKVIAKGSLREGILTFLPISVELQDIDRESADAGGDISPTLLFTGTFGGATQSGQFRLVEVPLKLVKQLVSFPPRVRPRWFD